MAHRDHEILAMIRVVPAEAKKRILAALRANGMHKDNTAKALSCSHCTLNRWITLLGLQKHIAKMMKEARKEGWYVNGRTGRPKGSTVKNGAARRGTKTAAATKQSKSGQRARSVGR